MVWDPALVVGTGGTGDRDRTDKTDLVGVRALGLGDNGSEPSVVDEIAGGTETGCEKEVQEETVVLGCVSGEWWDCREGGGEWWDIYAYIWGSKREVGASTTEIVWL